MNGSGSGDAGYPYGTGAGSSSTGAGGMALTESGALAVPPLTSAEQGILRDALGSGDAGKVSQLHVWR